MFWFILLPAIFISTLLCASLCVVASDSDQIIEDITRGVHYSRPQGA